MGVLDNLIKWFTAKDKHGNDVKLGYVLDDEPRTMEDIEKLMKAFRLEQYLDHLRPLVRPKIELTLVPAAESTIKPAQSKIGGLPDMRKDQEWPKNELGQSLSFIGQLNFKEVAPFDTTGLLPKQGLLLFFYCANQEAWGFKPQDAQRFKTLYIEDPGELEKAHFPPDLEAHARYTANRLNFTSCLSIPGWKEDVMLGLIEDEDFDNYTEASRGSDNQILGYANCVQDTMELECQLVSNGLDLGSPSGYEDPRREALEAGKEDWVLLLQVDSEEDKAGMCWGDVGRIYFWIRKQDLMQARFDNTWCILQCY